MERTAWVVAIGCALLPALLVPWIVRRADPELAVQSAWFYGKPRTYQGVNHLPDGRWLSTTWHDPWGGPWMHFPDGRAYSFGPNGVDEGMAGDDVRAEWTRTRHLGPQLVSMPGELGLACAGLVAWLVFTARFLRAPGRSVSGECVVVGAYLLLTAGYWGGLAWRWIFSYLAPFKYPWRWLVRGREALHAALPGETWLPAHLVDGAGLLFALALACLWSRLNPEASRRLAPGLACGFLAGGSCMWALHVDRDPLSWREVLLELLLASLVALGVGAAGTWATARGSKSAPAPESATAA